VSAGYKRKARTLQLKDVDPKGVGLGVGVVGSGVGLERGVAQVSWQKVVAC